MAVVGKVVHIARYPVKSMRSESLDSTNVGFQGIAGDRMYAFVQEGVHSPFPWLTARDYQGILGYQPCWEEIDGKRRLTVGASSDALAIDSPELREKLERESGRKLRLHSDHRGNHDIAYVSVITTATIARLAAEAGVSPDHRRFRMNVIVESDLPAFAEREWVGQTVRLGECALAVTEQDRRCVMITFDPETGAPSPSVLKVAGQLNDAFAGVYASVAAAGTVSVGDAVVVGG